LQLQVSTRQQRDLLLLATAAFYRPEWLVRAQSGTPSTVSFLVPLQAALSRSNSQTPIVGGAPSMAPAPAPAPALSRSNSEASVSSTATEGGRTKTGIQRLGRALSFGLGRRRR
jgi:hypothetical protein